jgi:hypothetical protein
VKQRFLEHFADAHTFVGGNVFHHRGQSSLDAGIHRHSLDLQLLTCRAVGLAKSKEVAIQVFDLELTHFPGLGNGLAENFHICGGVVCVKRIHVIDDEIEPEAIGASFASGKMDRDAVQAHSSMRGWVTPQEFNFKTEMLLVEIHSCREVRNAERRHDAFR